MANRIVKDSQLSIFVKEIQVAAAGTAEADVPKVNTFIRKGAIAGLIGDTPHQGEDGAFYATVDTAALIRVDHTGAVNDKAPVYAAANGTLSATTGAGALPVGYADRPKASGAGQLWLQLIPTAGVAAA